jgi:hypothetical protein
VLLAYAVSWSTGAGGSGGEGPGSTFPKGEARKLWIAEEGWACFRSYFPKGQILTEAVDCRRNPRRKT